jgi:hypothetical protein
MSRDGQGRMCMYIRRFGVCVYIQYIYVCLFSVAVYIRNVPHTAYALHTYAHIRLPTYVDAQIPSLWLRNHTMCGARRTYHKYACISSVSKRPHRPLCSKSLVWVTVWVSITLSEFRANVSSTSQTQRAMHCECLFISRFVSCGCGELVQSLAGAAAALISDQQAHSACMQLMCSGKAVLHLKQHKTPYCSPM